MLKDRFNQEVWDVLQGIGGESLIAGKNGIFEFTLTRFKLLAPGIPSVSRARKIIKNYLAEQEEAIKIIEEVKADWGASIPGLFRLQLIQPIFDKLYAKFQAFNSTQEGQISKNDLAPEDKKVNQDLTVSEHKYDIDQRSKEITWNGVKKEWKTHHKKENPKALELADFIFNEHLKQQKDGRIDEESACLRVFNTRTVKSKRLYNLFNNMRDKLGHMFKDCEPNPKAVLCWENKSMVVRL